jgi:hypothetical protein
VMDSVRINKGHAAGLDRHRRTASLADSPFVRHH